MTRVDSGRDGREQTSGRWPRAINFAALDADVLVAAAIRSQGLQDFGPLNFREPLQRLLISYREEARLSTFGRLAARWDCLRLLGNLLRLQRAFAHAPGLADESVTAPIVITGLPRSGSTFLHRLLAVDPHARVPRHLEVIHPFDDRAHVRARRELRMLHLLAPRLSAVHPMQPEAPQECTEIFSNGFRSLRFDTTHRVPGYRRWLDAHGSRDAYRLHRRFLQYWQSRDRRARQWILKSPDHVFTLPDLLSVYPDARIVFTHRDPLAVLPSVANLTVLLRQLFSRDVDPASVGQEVAARWAEGVRRMLDFADTALIAQRIFHLRSESLISDPVQAVEDLYHHFDLPMTDAARGRLRVFVAAHPRGDYANNRYRPEDFGLRPERVRACFERYRYRWLPTAEDGNVNRQEAA